MKLFFLPFLQFFHNEVFNFLETLTQKYVTQNFDEKRFFWCFLTRTVRFLNIFIFFISNWPFLPLYWELKVLMIHFWVYLVSWEIFFYLDFHLILTLLFIEIRFTTWDLTVLKIIIHNHLIFREGLWSLSPDLLLPSFIGQISRLVTFFKNLDFRFLFFFGSRFNGVVSFAKDNLPIKINIYMILLHLLV